MLLQAFIKCSSLFYWLIFLLNISNIKDSQSFKSISFQKEKISSISFFHPFQSQSTNLQPSCTSSHRSKCFIIYAGIKVGYHSGEKSGFRGWANPKHLKRKRAKEAEEWAKWIKKQRPQRKHICLRIRDPHSWSRIKQRRKMFSPWFNGTISPVYQEILLKRYYDDLAKIPSNVITFTKPSAKKSNMKPKSILPPIMLASLNITT
jgi:hypothetical protein